jgi:hypothetical protein
MEKKFRESSDNEQLSQFLNKKKQEGSDFLIWQNHNPKKITFNAAVVMFQITNERVVIDFNANVNKVIKKGKSIYLFSEKENILLKGQISLLNKGNIKITINSSFYLNENRLRPRFDFSEKSINCGITRRIELKNIDKSETMKLRDISEQGCSFLISSSRATNYQAESSLTINTLGKMELEIPITGVIKHSTPVKLVNSVYSTSFAVGVKFEHEFHLLPEFIELNSMDK